MVHRSIQLYAVGDECGIYKGQECKAAGRVKCGTQSLTHATIATRD